MVITPLIVSRFILLRHLLQTAVAKQQADCDRIRIAEHVMTNGLYLKTSLCKLLYVVLLLSGTLKGHQAGIGRSQMLNAS